MNTESMGTGMSGGPGGSGGKVPIYELAKELGIPNKDLVTKIQAMGIEAKNHMSRLDMEDAIRVRRAIEKARQENTVEERVSETVIRRRSKDGSMLHPAAARGPAEPPKPQAPAPPAPPTVIVRKRAEAPSAPAPSVAESRPAPAPVAAKAPAPEPRTREPSREPSRPAEAPAQAREARASRPADTAKAPETAPTAVQAQAQQAHQAQAQVAPPAPAAAKEAPAAAPPAREPAKEAAPAVEAAAPVAEAPPRAEEARPAQAPAAAQGEPPAQAAPAQAAPAPAAAPAAEVKAEADLSRTETAPAPAVSEAAETAAPAAPARDKARPAPAAGKEEAQAARAATTPPEVRKQQPSRAPEPRGHDGGPGERAGGPGSPTVIVRPGRDTQAPRPPGQQQAQAGTPAGAGGRPGSQSSRPQPAASATPGPGAGPAPAPAEPPKVFVTAQTRRTNEGLGPTGRFIDLAALRPSAPPRQEQASAPPPPPPPAHVQGRGPRREISGEQLRQPQRPQHTRPQQKSKIQPGKKAKPTPITQAAEHKRVVKMGEGIVVNELARQMGLKATDVLKKVWELGVRNVMINSPIDFDTAQLVAAEFEWRVESTVFQESAVVEEVTDKPEDLMPRAPVVTIMGHVDHGKTSLLDAIRNANVAAGEAGGITQHIGAYKVAAPSGDVVFLDTPGHEAFTEMRARGAQVTDIVVLVVAADDGVMPQTLEALNHAKDAKVPIIVAVNKVDKPQAQPDRIRQQLSAHGLTPEEWGGETIYCDVSARTRLGVDKMLEMLALQSEVLELKANPKRAARGTVVEARMDAKRGPVATVLVQEGTLNIGDMVVVGEEMGKVRAMVNDRGQNLSSAGPSTPVELLGLSGVPRAGEVLNAVSDDRAAKELVEHRRQKRVDRDRTKTVGTVSLQDLMAAMQAGLKELKVILKADVQGSAEALSAALTKLSTPQVKVTIIQSGVGGITESDVNLAKAGNAVIIGFHVRPAGKAAALAEQEGVDIKLYDIIYEALDDVKKAMAGLLAPVKKEKGLGKAEVRKVFMIPKIGAVAGSFVTEGVVKRSGQVRLVRDSVEIYKGKLGSLRRFKDDVREVQAGYECGLSIEGYNDIKEGDVIECYEIEEIAATLS